MKNPKKLTYREKQIIGSWGIKGDYWYRVKKANGYITIYNDIDHSIREVPDHMKGEYK